MTTKTKTQPVVPGVECRVCCFAFERSTKNTHRFTEVGSGHIGTLYVQQSAFPDGAPETITVTIQAD